jgi:methyl-accepting chemotaxis protein
VRKSADELNEICAETSADTKNISEAAQEQSAGVVEVASSSRGLSEIANGMKQHIAKFKL